MKFLTVILSVFLSLEVLAQEAAAVANAQAVTSEQPSFLSALVSMMPMVAICYLIFYLMVIKPQAAKVKEHNELVSKLSRGDTVVTSGGIVGKVAATEGDLVVLEVSQGVKIKVESLHISKKPEEPKKVA